MAFLKTLTGVSPSLEAFLLLRVKISLLISSNETKLKVNNSEYMLFGDLAFFNANMVVVVTNNVF